MLDFNPGEHICVVGDARPEKTNPIYLAHEKVILILVVERATGLIVDADTNMVCELTRRFLRSVLWGTAWWTTWRRSGTAFWTTIWGTPSGCCTPPPGPPG